MSKKISRRKFLKMSAGAGIAVAASGLLPWKFGARDAFAFYQSPTTVPLYATALRGISTIGVAAPDAFAAPVTGVKHYTINIDQYQDQITPLTSGLGPTTLRGFNPVNLLAGQASRIVAMSFCEPRS